MRDTLENCLRLSQIPFYLELCGAGFARCDVINGRGCDANVPGKTLRKMKFSTGLIALSALLLTARADDTAGKDEVKGPIIGIDLGTTYRYVGLPACLTDPPTHPTPDMIILLIHPSSVC